MPALGELPGSRPEPQRGSERPRAGEDTRKQAIAEATVGVDDRSETADASDETAQSSEAKQAPDPRRRFRR
jgi:hypothetical protein